ncbi:endonuclease [Pedobacter sp. MC2016-15]|uniref:DNA-formamidopyrimidine glycosylase family protein n=1 Tax=Pedobacter sp. MC2016-15 TaxID=2994473 RepID=UPI0022481BC0|nr:endonuclease [Pedobacter sp. MC2016-15]MCX2477464.1 endonuclease [Pedobacter sp. MC2016-15]
MPEGPPIVILKEKMDYLKHKIVSEASGYAEIDMEALSHKKILDFKSWGKHFFICFNDFTIRIHFGLFGSYQFHEPKKVNPKLALHFNNDDVYFYVCTIERIEGALEDHYDFSADVMSDEWDVAKALGKLKDLPKKQIGDVLLDQKIFSGVGNIIKNEALYRAGVHPESLVGKIPAAKLKAIVKEARDFSFDFLKWRKVDQLTQNLEVYRRTETRIGEKPVVKKDTGKSKRSSYFSVSEQKLYQ